MPSISDTLDEYEVGSYMTTERENERPSKVIKHWHHEGIECAVYETRQSHYCGYVNVPDGLIGKVRFTSAYDELDGFIDANVQAHGGITYGPDEDNWVGFDTAHAWDGNFDSDMEELPNTIGSIGDPEFIWQPSDVVEETEGLAERIVALAEEHGIDIEKE